MNILFVLVLVYGTTFGLQNALNRLISLLHGHMLHQNILGQIIDGLFYVGIALLCFKWEEVTLWGLL